MSSHQLCKNIYIARSDRDVCWPEGRVAKTQHVLFLLSWLYVGELMLLSYRITQYEVCWLPVIWRPDAMPIGAKGCFSSVFIGFGLSPYSKHWTFEYFKLLGQTPLLSAFFTLSCNSPCHHHNDSIDGKQICESIQKQSCTPGFSLDFLQPLPWGYKPSCSR